MDNTYITQNAELLAKIATIGSFVVAVSALIFTYLQSRFRKHEIKRAYYCEVLEWYSKTISILSNLNYCLKTSHDRFTEKRDKLLPMLFAQIEIGRFYFPNKKNDYGNEKPLAYQGFRNIVLDFLVFSYDLYKRDDIESYIPHIDKLQREFTSIIFEILRPSQFVRDTAKLTNVKFYKDWSIDDIVLNDPTYIEIILSNSMHSKSE